MREQWLAVLLVTVSSLPTAGDNEVGREATVLLQRAEAALSTGEPGLGRADAERALALFQRVEDLSAQAAALSLVGSAELAEGRTEGLFSFLSEALSRAARAQDDFAIAALAATLGRLAPDVDRTDQAEGLLAKAFEALARLRLGHRQVRWFEIHHAALGLPAPGEWTANTQHRLDDRDLDTALGVVLHYRGSFRMWAAGRFDDARTDLVTALEKLPADHTQRDLVAVDLAAVEARARQFEPAYARLRTAAEALRGRCCTPQILSGLELALWLLADIDDDRGRFDEALSWNAQGLELARGQKNLTGETELLVKRSRIEQHAGRVEAALKTLETARDTAQASRNQTVIDRVARAFAIRNIAAGRLEEASKVLAAPVSEAGGQDRCTAGYSRLLLVASYALANRPRDAAAAWETYSEGASASSCQEVDFFARIVRSVIMTGESSSGGELVTEIGDPSNGLLLRPEGLEILGILQAAAKGRPPRDLLVEELEPKLRRAQERRDAAAERKFRLLRGEILLELGDFSAARDDVVWLTHSARQANDPATQISAAWLASRIARKLGRTDEAIRHLEEALTLEEASLAELTLDEFLLAGAGGAALQYETLVELLLDAGREEQAFAVAERSRSLALVRLLAGAPAAAPTSPGDHEARREVERLRAERRALADRQARGEMDAQSFAAESSRLNARFDEATLRLKLTLSREAPGPAPAPPG